MPENPFDVTVEHAGGAAVLRMTGDVNRTAQESLEAGYSQVVEDTVVLDFTDVSYINSTGIAVIVGILAKARASGRELRAYGLTDHYRQIFQITRIADFMAIYEDEQAAVAAH